MRSFLLSVLLTLPAVAQTPAASPSERGWQVLEAALKAAGGREKLEAVQDLSFELQTRVLSPQGEFDVRSDSKFIFPGTARQNSEMPFGEVNLATDGKTGWMKGPKGLGDLPPEQVRQMQADLARANLLFRPPRDRSRVKWVAEETVDGKLCDVLEIDDVGGGPLRLSVDRRSGDVLKRAYRADAPGGGGMTSVEEVLSDYRSVSGLRLSFRVRVMRDGKLARDSMTRQLRVNSGLDPQELLRRPGA